jgi:hypothetical protein
MIYCNEINFELEKEECSVADEFDSNPDLKFVCNTAFGRIQKHCIDENNNIKEYIHCYRYNNEIPQA